MTGFEALQALKNGKDICHKRYGSPFYKISSYEWTNGNGQSGTSAQISNNWSRQLVNEYDESNKHYVIEDFVTLLLNDGWELYTDCDEESK
jgi:hypothetical protein